MKKLCNTRLLLFALILFLGTGNYCFAQMGINTTNASPANSAMLDVASNSKGVLIPRVSLASTVDVSTVPAPAVSLLVYNTNASMTNGKGTGFYYYDGNVWQPLMSGSTPSGSNPPGGIIMYSGAWNFDTTGLGTGTLSGWALCNGQNGTPDLSDKFVMGTSTSGTLGATGGSVTHTHTGSISDKQWKVTAVGPDVKRAAAEWGNLPSIQSSNFPTLYSPTERQSYSEVITRYNNNEQAVYSVGDLLPEGHALLNQGNNQFWTKLYTLQATAIQSLSNANHLPTYYKLAYIMKL